MRIPTLSAAFVLVTSSGAAAAPLEDHARAAVSARPDAAIAALRAAGPAGLDAFLAVHDPEPGSAPAVLAALDRVCAQKDCVASRLFWFTDLDAAKAASRASGKPILSLHLLGRLDEEYSCANSRFFRATLYPDEAVSAAMRERFVLHWHSVRPAPKITIDFGDGRTLVRTITGNSIHYVLDADGRPVDAIPGLYGPKSFLRALGDGQSAFAAAKGKSGAPRAAALKGHHERKAEEALAAWAREMAKVKGQPIPPDLATLEAVTDDETWYRLADARPEDAELDAKTREHLVQRFGPSAEEAGERAMAKAVFENPMLRKIRTFQRTMGADALQNEWRFRTKIRRELARDPDRTVEALDAWVYETVFLTPMWDPWLGLKSDGFGGLDEG